MDDERRSHRVRAIGFLVAALLASGMAAVVGASDFLIGHAAAVVRPPDACAAIGTVTPDLKTAPPGVALKDIDALPLPPVNGLTSAIRTGAYIYATPADYTRLVKPLRPGPIERALTANGFVAGASAYYQGQAMVYAAEVFHFPSPAQAASFQRQSLLDGCREGVMTNVTPLGNQAGGFTYTLHAARLPTRAAFLIGDSVVRLGVCGCVEYVLPPDGVVSLWASDVDARLRIPPPR